MLGEFQFQNAVYFSTVSIFFFFFSLSFFKSLDLDILKDYLAMKPFSFESFLKFPLAEVLLDMETLHA